ncbi:MAG: SusD/RagB family nutrient-binding outer membrane lipoprotein [Siphonobacter sp.]
MKRLFNKLSILSLLVVGFACKPGEFGDTNVDPTQVSSATTKALLTNTLQSLPGTFFSNNHANFYVQYLSEGPYPGSSLYSTVNFDWGGYYYGPLENLQAIIDYNEAGASNADEGENGSKNNQLAVAHILKAYYFWWLTDRYGDLPYSEALQGSENYSPAYDSQQELYYALFTELEEGVALINTSEQGVSGDILFDGDMTMWLKFANTTRLYMSLRLIKNDFEKGKTEFNEALSAGVLTSQDDNMFYQYIASDPNNYNPWYSNYTVSARNDYAISTTMTDYMQPLDDPRLPIYGEVLSSGSVRGLTYGSSAARNIPTVYSRIGDYFREAGSPAALYTYPQLLFVMAEAAKVGYIDGGDTVAEEYYNQAIKESFTMYDVFDQTTYDTYIANSTVAYASGTGLQQIITQKWVHQYLNGYEAWADWRRTGYPTLTPAADGSISSIPRRQGYPTTESSLNSTHYKEAVARQGADALTTQIWWDK